MLKGISKNFKENYKFRLESLKHEKITKKEDTNIIDAFETSLYPKTLFYCEPNLGKRNLYPTISQKGNYSEVRLRMNLLAFCDGKTNIFQICNKINIPLKNVCDELKILKRNKILL